MIAVLCGGVGAAKLLSGLVRVVAPEDLVGVVNTGDDLALHGLSISPDLDTITYTLAGAVNPETGWGLAGETYSVLGALERYGAPAWFRLGDRDFATHLYRSERLASGATLTEVTAEITSAWGLRVSLLPMSDDPVRTHLVLDSGEEVDFQEYFVHRRHDVSVRAVRFDGAEQARPGARVLESIEGAEVIVVAPSNPVVSIGPILAVPGVADALRAARDRVVAVSPIVGGRALKGPADRLLVELGAEASALGVGRWLVDVVGHLVIDEVDAGLAGAIEALGMGVTVTGTVMSDPDAAAALGRAVLAAGNVAAEG